MHFVDMFRHVNDTILDCDRQTDSLTDIFGKHIYSYHVT